MARDAFFASIWPSVLQAAQTTGVDPRIIAAQAALESNYGKSAPGNNLFGIKSHGKGGGNSLMTTEVINGKPVRVRDSFRGYASPADSVAGYADFINTNKRYRPFREADGLEAQIAALGRSGYATDPNYAAKIGSIAGRIPSGLPTLPPGPDGPKGQESYPRAAPDLPPPTTIADRPVASPIDTAAAPSSPPPPGLLSILNGGDGPKGQPSALNSMLAMLAQPQQPQQIAPMPQQAPQGPTLSDFVAQFMQSRKV